MNEPGKVIDISRTLTPATAVWPGDQPVEIAWTARIADGATVNLSAIRFSTHAATHADAPRHYEVDGAPIEELPLLHFVGPCFVINARKERALHPALVTFNDALRCPRLLFRTRHSDVGDGVWDPDLAPILPETVERMARQGVVLVGTDAPSVDAADSTSLDAHHALARHGIVNLENLALDGVEAGPYWLSALPLKVQGLDAAPVRAVLVAFGSG